MQWTTNEIMIGVFDSGFGGLVILKELNKQFPEYDFVYLGDNARAPYGTRSKKEVYDFTLEAVEYLFVKGCELVILACNTASANALRKIQQEILPRKYPGRRVLGILVPTIEQVTDTATTNFKKIAIFATPLTVASGAYELEIKKRHSSAQVFSVGCPMISVLIENDAPKNAIEKEISKHVEELKNIMGEGWPPEAVLLGCTHYPLVYELFISALPSTVHVYDQAVMVAESLRDYLLRHLEFEQKVGKHGARVFLTTGNVQNVQKLASRFYGKEIKYQSVTLPVLQ